jgi:hypothetical protein
MLQVQHSNSRTSWNAARLSSTASPIVLVDDIDDFEANEGQQRGTHHELRA